MNQNRVGTAIKHFEKRFEENKDIIYELTQEKMLMIGPYNQEYLVSFRHYYIKNN